jgi:dienelactone hydrolase
MKNIFITLLLLSGIFPCTYAQNDLDVYPYWTYYGDMSQNLYRQLYGVASRQLSERQSVISELRTKADWEQRQAKVKEMLRQIVGEFPDKTPLNPVITGKLTREDVTVEKLYFESRPGLYVTAALFIPTKRKGKMPAILYCSGHSGDGFRSDVYQKTILNLVRQGFIVLAFDPIGQGERYQYLNEEGEIILGPTHEHSYPGSQSFISGRSPANYFIWDGIRAIDYLISRKEVDPLRIGITGRSGGGTQTAYIAAMDNRVVAAAPECYITTFDMLLRSGGPQDAEQNLMYAPEKGFDIGDLIQIRAPKPVLMVTTTRDIFSIQGARNVFQESQAIYAVYGKPENLQKIEDDAGHAHTKKNGEATYAFFQRHLNNPGNPEELEVAIFDEKELWVTPNGQIQKFIPSETLFSLNEKYTNTLLVELQAKRADYPEFLKNIRAKAIEMTGYQKPEASKEYIFSGRSWRDGYAVEKYLIKGSGDYYIPLLRLLPKGQAKEMLLLLDDNGKSSAVTEGLGGQLAQKGYEVIIPDLSGIGELGGGYTRGDAFIQEAPLNVWYAGVLTHKTPLALRVEEIDAVVGFIREINNHSGKITGLACGTLTADLLHSAVIGEHFEKIVLVRPLVSYLSVVQEREYRTKFVMSAVPEVIGEYDLPDLVAAIAPQKVLMINPVNALDKQMDASTNDTYDHAKAQYERSGHVQFMTVRSIQFQEVLPEIIQWLNKSNNN